MRWMRRWPRFRARAPRPAPAAKSPLRARPTSAREAAAAVHAHGARLLALRSRDRTLEDIYLRYFQEAAVA